MNCLFGCLFLPFELAFDALLDGWLYLMELIIPQRMKSKAAHIAITVLVWIFSALLLLAVFVGVILLFNPDPLLKSLGKTVLCTSLSVSAVQITVGIILQIVRKRKNGRNQNL